MNFEDVIDKVLDREAPKWRQGDAGFTDDPADSGGPTAYGVTQAVARANGYHGEMRDMPLSFAREVYRKRFIVRPGFDKVWLASIPVGNELIDTGVNMGPAVAATMLQRWLNGLNAQGSRYADLFVDGAIGEVTVEALRKFLRWRGADGERVLVAALNCTQGTHYLEIAERKAANESFLYGWILNRVVQPA